MRTFFSKFQNNEEFLQKATFELEQLHHQSLVVSYRSIIDIKNKYWEVQFLFFFSFLTDYKQMLLRHYTPRIGS